MDQSIGWGFTMLTLHVTVCITMPYLIYYLEGKVLRRTEGDFNTMIEIRQNHPVLRVENQSLGVPITDTVAGTLDAIVDLNQP